MNERLKKIIFKKLYKDLSHVEIIPFKESIWFISREERYWYFEYTKKGILWWRWAYFTDFFQLFSLESDQFQLVLSEWVEDVLNCKVITTNLAGDVVVGKVEEVLNCKVITPILTSASRISTVEGVLNCKVKATYNDRRYGRLEVEEVLSIIEVEEVLNNT